MSVLKFIQKHWFEALLATCFALLLGVITAFLGVLIGPAIKLLTTNSLTQTIELSALFGEQLGAILSRLLRIDAFEASAFFAMLPFLLLTIAAVKAVSSIAQWFIWERLGERYSLELRSMVMRRYLKLDPEVVVANPRIDESIASCLSTDIKYVREYLVRFYGGIPREGAQIVFLLVTLYFLSADLLAIFMFGVFPCVLILRYLGKHLRRRARASLTEFALMSEWIQQRLLGIETIKHLGTEDIECATMQTRNQLLYKKLCKAEAIKAISGPLLEAAAVVAMGLVLYISLRNVYDSGVGGAVQLSFFGSLALLGQAGGKLGKYFNSNREANAALNRISALAEEFDRNDRAEVALPSNVDSHLPRSLHLVCTKLMFEYKNGGRPALRDFSASFLSGRIYCIAGHSGSGKSTLMRMLLGILRPTSGEIVAVNKESFSHENLIGYLPQKHHLLNESLAKNICYPDENPDLPRVRDALRAVRLSELESQLHDGLSTLVGAEGRRFSGGQEQRVHLARLIYHRYPIMLIDEGTSALDPESEQVVYDVFQELARQDVLVILVAHRPRAFAIADEMILLKEGLCVASGARIDVHSHPLFQELVAVTAKP